MKRGRRKGSGVKSSINREQPTDTRHKLLHSHRDSRMVRLRQLILALKKEQATAQRNMLVEERKACRDEKKRKDYDKAIHESNDVLAALEQDDGNAWTLADNYLSARKAEIESQIATKNNQLSKKPALPRFHLTTREQKVLDKLRASQRAYVLLDEIDSLWKTWSAQCERAVLNADADWFRRQANAIVHRDKRTGAQKDRARFEAEVWRLLTVECVPERKILDGDTCFVQRKDEQPLTDKEKQEIRELEQLNRHAVVEDMIGKSYKRTDDGDYVAVSKGGGALIVEWTLGKRRYSCRFKNGRCVRDAIRDIAKL